jgi:hypothetical protein
MAEGNQSEITTIGRTRTDVAQVLALGANAWTVCLLLPALLAVPTSGMTLVWVLVPLGALGAGGLCVGRRTGAAAWLLLAAYPVAVAAVAAVLPSLTVQHPYSTVGTSLAAASMVAFGAGSAYAVGAPRVLRAATARPLGGVVPVEESPRRRMTRRLLLTLTGLGAAAIAVIAPGAGAVREYFAAWGEAAPEAATLTAVAAAAVATASIALVVGPSLRASRGPLPSRQQTRRRFLGFLVSVGLGLLFYVFYVLAGG